MRRGCVSVLAALVASVAGAGEIRVTSCEIFDDCYCHDTDGTVDPAEFVLLRIGFENVGSSPALNLRGRIAVVSGARPLTGFGTFGPLAPIGPGEVHHRAVYLQVDAACDQAIDLDIDGLTTTSLPSAHPAAPVACDHVVGGAECTPCCLPEDVDPIAGVRAVKADVDDVRLAWGPDPSPSASHYNVWRVTGAWSRSGIPAAREAGPWPVVASCDKTYFTECRDFNAVAGPAGEVRYYQVRGVCGTVEAAE